MWINRLAIVIINIFIKVNALIEIILKVTILKVYVVIRNIKVQKYSKEKKLSMLFLVFNR